MWERGKRSWLSTFPCPVLDAFYPILPTRQPASRNDTVMRRCVASQPTDIRVHLVSDRSSTDHSGERGTHMSFSMASAKSATLRARMRNDCICGVSCCAGCGEAFLATCSSWA